MMRNYLIVLCILPLAAGLARLFNDLEDDASCQKAYPVDGGWGDWSDWSICLITCDSSGKGGVQIRRRECGNPIARYGGKQCEGESIEEVKGCNSNLKCPVDGGWGNWKASGKCSVSCGEGMMEYYRECNNPQPKHCGGECSGPAMKLKSCKTIECPTTTTTPPPTTTTTTPPPTTTTPSPTTTTTPPTDSPTSEGCEACFEKASQNGRWWGACRTSQSECDTRGNEEHIRHMYTAKGWFFLHCSPDGPWCKPCASPSLVYNPKCGQCERSRDEPCTGPQNWQ